MTANNYTIEDFDKVIADELEYLREDVYGSKQSDICLYALRQARAIAAIPVQDREYAVSEARHWMEKPEYARDNFFDTVSKTITATLEPHDGK